MANAIMKNKPSRQSGIGAKIEKLNHATEWRAQKEPTHLICLPHDKGDCGILGNEFDFQ